MKIFNRNFQVINSPSCHILSQTQMKNSKSYRHFNQLEVCHYLLAFKTELQDCLPLHNPQLLLVLENRVLSTQYSLTHTENGEFGQKEIKMKTMTYLIQM